MSDNLTAVLDTEPQEILHYALNDTKKSPWYYYSSGMIIFRFWLKYLDIYGNENHKNFLKQEKENNYYNAYHDNKTKKDSCFTNDNPMLSPRISYRKASKNKKLYDIKFQARKCDMCETAIVCVVG